MEFVVGAFSGACVFLYLGLCLELKQKLGEAERAERDRTMAGLLKESLSGLPEGWDKALTWRRKGVGIMGGCSAKASPLLFERKDRA